MEASVTVKRKVREGRVQYCISCVEEGQRNPAAKSRKVCERHHKAQYRARRAEKQLQAMEEMGPLGQTQGEGAGAAEDLTAEKPEVENRTPAILNDVSGITRDMLERYENLKGSLVQQHEFYHTVVRPGSERYPFPPGLLESLSATHHET